MQIIRDWFNAGRHYESGIVLYEAYSSTRTLMPMLRQGRSEYREAKLASALEALIREEAPAVVVPQKVPAAPTVAAPVATEKPDPFKQRWAPLYAEMNFLRHNLLAAETNAKRGEMAHRILELESACETFWEMRREWERTGKMPVERPETRPEVVVTTDYNKLQQRQANLRTYISRAGSRPMDEKTLVKMDKWKAELEIVQKALKDGGY